MPSFRILAVVGNRSERAWEPLKSGAKVWQLPPILRQKDYRRWWCGDRGVIDALLPLKFHSKTHQNIVDTEIENSACICKIKYRRDADTKS